MTDTETLEALVDYFYVFGDGSVGYKYREDCTIGERWLEKAVKEVIERNPDYQDVDNYK